MKRVFASFHLLAVCFAASAVAVRSASAAPVVCDLNGATRALEGNGLNTLVEEYGNEVLVKNGTLTATYADAGCQFGYVGIGEGATLTVSGDWNQSTTDGELAVLTGGTVNFKGDNTKFAFRKGVNKLTIDGGTVNVTKYLGPGNSAFSADGQDVCSIVTMKSGKLNVGTHIYLGYANPKTYTKSNKTYYYTAKSYSSEFYLNGGEVKVEGTFYIGNSHQTDRVTGSPDQMLAVLGPGEVTFNKMAIYKGTPSTNVRFNGVTLHTGSKPSDPWIGTVDNVEYGNYVMDEGGVTLDVAKDAKIARPINQGDHEGGIYGALVKTGSAKLTLAFEQRFLGPVVCQKGTIAVAKPLASKSIEARGGVIDFTDGGSLASPLDEVDVAMTDGGNIVGLDFRKPYKSLTLGGGMEIAMTFGPKGCETPFTAAKIDVSAASEAEPIVLVGAFDGIAGLDQSVAYTIIPAASAELEAGDEKKFTLTGIAGELKVVNGALVATPSARPNAALVWQGKDGADWATGDAWLYDGVKSVSFQNGDTAVFATKDAHATVGGAVTATKLIATADATVDGDGTISTPEIEVKDGAELTFGATVSRDWQKTGGGRLVLAQTQTQPVEVAEGTLAFANGEDELLPKEGCALGATLDLGGGVQHLTGTLEGGGTGVFRDGAAIVNGTLTVVPLEKDWWRMDKTTFTVGKDATLVIEERTDQGGEIGFRDHARLVIDGGRVEALNRRGGSNNSDYASYVGCDQQTKSEIRITGGGVFRQPSLALNLGGNKGATGVISVDDGTVDLAGWELRMAADGATGVLALTNGQLKAHALQICKANNAANHVELTMKDSTAYLGVLYSSSAPDNGSFAVFDNVTIVPQGSSDAEKARFFDDLRIPAVTLAGDGLTISNDYDVAVKESFSGTGKLKKAGPAALTLSTKQTFTGGIDLREGTLVFADGVEFEGRPMLTAAGGTTVRVALTDAGIVGTRSLALAVDSEASGKVKVEIDPKVLPDEGRNYTLFAGGVTSEMVATRLELPEGFGYAVNDSGVLTMTIKRLTQEWTGGGETPNWSEGENWSKRTCPAAGDGIRFVNAEGGETVCDLAATEFLSIDFEVGAWTVDLGGSAFNTKALTVAKTGELRLVNAPENPLPLANGLVELRGLVDFGGATQKIGSLFGYAVSFRQGTIAFTGTGDQTLKTSFAAEDLVLDFGERNLTVGASGKSPTLQLVDSSLAVASLTLNENASLVFDGATLVERNCGVQFLREGGVPYTLGEGGLTILVGDRTADRTEITVPGRFEGTGDVVIAAQGTKPKDIRFSADNPDKGISGRLVVKAPLYLRALSKNFAGSALIEAGAKVDFSGSKGVSVFDGRVTIEDGVDFAAIESGKVYEEPLELVASRTGFDSPLLGKVDAETGNAYFVRSQDGLKVLCYGSVPPTMFIIH